MKSKMTSKDDLYLLLSYTLQDVACVELSETANEKLLALVDLVFAENDDAFTETKGNA